MVAPGPISVQSVVNDPISVSGSIGKYDLYTQVGVGPTGTVVGSVSAVIVQAKALTQLKGVSVAGYSESTGSVIGLQVHQFGKGIGSLIGSVVAGTVIADTNTVLLKAYNAGTVATAGGQLVASEVVAGAVLVGTVVLQEIGT